MIKFHKAIAILLTVVLLLSLCACNKRAEKAESSESESGKSPAFLPTEAEQREDPSKYNSDDYMWVTSTNQYFPLDPGFTINKIAFIGSALMIAGTNEANHILALADCTTSYTSEPIISDAQEIQLDDPNASNEEWIYDVVAGEDGYFYVLAGEEPAERTIDRATGEKAYNPDFAGNFCVLKFDVDGNYLEKMIFNHIFESGKPATGLTVSLDRTLVINTTEDYLVMNWSGEKKYSAFDELLQILGFQTSDMGIVGSVIYNGEPNHGFRAILLNSDGSYTFLDQGSGSLSRCRNNNGKALFNDGSTLFNYDFANHESIDIINWNYGNQMGGACSGVYQIGENHFAYTMYKSDSLFIVSKLARPKIERSTVHVALINTDTAEGDAIELNNSDSKFYYQCTEYDTADINRLLTEISSGNGPDLILFNGNVDTRSSQFENLYDYIDSDPELSRSSFIPNLLSAMETDGELHEIWTGVQISTLAARTSDVGNGRGLTTEDYDRILDENDNYYSVFQSFMTGSNLLSWIADISSGEYIDWNNGTCHFTDQSFADLLEWCKKMAPEYEGEQANISYDISEVILSVETISDVRRITSIRDNLGEPFTFVGFPSSNGQGHYFSCAYGCSAAIPSTSKNIEGAWEFIRAQLMTQKQISSYPIDGLPVISDALERVANTNLGRLEINVLEELVNNTTKAISYGDQQIRSIIVEAGNGYLSGGRTIEDTVAAIQSRISVYVAEKTGL